MTGVIINDAVPAQILNPQYATSLSGPWSTWTGSYNAGALVANASKNLYIQGTVDPLATVSITNTAIITTVNGDATDPDLSNNVSTNTTLLNVSADLSMSKTCTTSPVVAGQQIQYTLTVLNLGPSSSIGVVITDAVSTAIANVQYSLSPSGPWNTWSGSFVVGTLLPSANVSVYIRGIVDDSVIGSLSNTAVASSNTPDPNQTNNTAISVVTVTALADIQIIKTCTTSPVVAGQLIQYTLTVLNNGPSHAQNVLFSDAVPPSISNPQYSTDGGTTWNAWTSPYSSSNLATGGTVTILLRGTVNSNVSGSIVNTANVSSITPDPDLTNNTSTVTSTVTTSADLSMIKTCNTSPVVAGQPIQYTLTMHNNGPSDALAVSVSDAVPASISNPQYSTDGGTTWSSWSSPYSVGTMTSGSTVTILLRGTVNSNVSGSIVNTASVSSTTPDPIPGNNTSTVITPMNASADLSIVKTCNTSPVVAGQSIQYTLTVHNNGPSDAIAVSVSDAVPASISNPQYSTNGGTTWNTWSSPYNVGTMTPTSTVTILLRGTVNSNVTGSIVNTANVSSTTPDPDLTNNTSTVTSTVTTSADLSMIKTCNTSPVVAGQPIQVMPSPFRSATRCLLALLILGIPSITECLGVHGPAHIVLER
jgi:uncharacterized repeat protein (TIGR01451 family)